MTKQLINLRQHWTWGLNSELRRMDACEYDRDRVVAYLRQFDTPHEAWDALTDPRWSVQALPEFGLVTSYTRAHWAWWLLNQLEVVFASPGRFLDEDGTISLQEIRDAFPEPPL